jgi:hypothetical protein
VNLLTSRPTHAWHSSPHLQTNPCLTHSSQVEGNELFEDIVRKVMSKHSERIRDFEVTEEGKARAFRVCCGREISFTGSGRKTSCLPARVNSSLTAPHTCEVKCEGVTLTCHCPLVYR